MEVQRIHEGLWRWSVIRDGAEAASAYLEIGDSMVLVDPVLPAPGDDLDRFERAIGRDMARLGGPRWVMLTSDDDTRDADAAVRMTGARRWIPGDAAPTGITVLDAGPGCAALWAPEHSALMPGLLVSVREGQPVMTGAGDDTLDRLRELAARVIIPSVGAMWTAD